MWLDGLATDTHFGEIASMLYMFSSCFCYKHTIIAKAVSFNYVIQILFVLEPFWHSCLLKGSQIILPLILYFLSMWAFLLFSQFWSSVWKYPRLLSKRIKILLYSLKLFLRVLISELNVFYKEDFLSTWYFSSRYRGLSHTPTELELDELQHGDLKLKGKLTSHDRHI